MKIYVIFSDEEYCFSAEVSNILQVKDYLINCNKGLYDRISSCKSYFILEKDGVKTNLEKELIIDFSSYDSISIVASPSGKIELIGIITAVVIAIDYVILSTGFYKDLGDWWYILAPHRLLSDMPEMPDDPSIPNRDESYYFTANLNIREQGGSIPLIFGECLFQGVIVGSVLTNLDISVGSDLTVDKGIPEIPLNAIPTVNKSVWYRIV
jgi:predicted phage tail protein